jgi:hypothetical protein
VFGISKTSREEEEEEEERRITQTSCHVSRILLSNTIVVSML